MWFRKLYPQEFFIQWSNNIIFKSPWRKNDYSKVEYVKNRTKVEIICKSTDYFCNSNSHQDGKDV